jgi:hypothetical protein
MAVSGIYDYHVTKAGPKCTLVWMASCFVIPPSVKCRHLETWQEIPDELNSVEHDVDSKHRFIYNYFVLGYMKAIH